MITSKRAVVKAFGVASGLALQEAKQRRGSEKPANCRSASGAFMSAQP
ncbi:MAG: hypothetical protein ABI488_12515 [Polyangiaceae bacterium]